MNRLVTTVIAAAVAGALQFPITARAQDKAPPSWDTLAKCADMTDAAKELDCYRAAMRAAGYVRNPQVAAAERHKTFGVELPSLHKRAEKPSRGEKAEAGAAPAAEAEDADHITVKIVEVAYTRPLNQLLMVMSDGGVWVQTDTISLTFEPKPGQSLEIRKTRFGGYFCKFDRSNAVRCERRN